MNGERDVRMNNIKNSSFLESSVCYRYKIRFGLRKKKVESKK